MSLTSLYFTDKAYASGNYSENSIVTTVPMGAVTGPITVTSTYGTATSGTFTVTP
jgi:hypothetical protein